MHKEILRVALVMLCAVPPSIGQQTREVGHVDDPSALDSAHFMVSVVREYDSIAGLYLDSDLVIQGDIKKVLPTRDVSTPGGRGHTLITDFVVNVTHTFRGTAVSEVAVLQLGGVQGNMQRIPDQYRLMRAGEQYVLFLTQDRRLQSAALDYIPTYSVTGAWAGLFQIVNNALQLSPATHAALRGRYEGQVPTLLLSDLESMAR